MASLRLQTSDRLGDRYTLGERIGCGGVADVYRAQDERLGRDVAIKVFRDDSPHSDREDREIRLLASLDHPYLVTVFDAGVDLTASVAQRFLVMELVEGGSLRLRLSQGAMPEREVRTLGQHLADALTHIHDRGIVHRDVKPANILCSTHGVYKLTDFGIASMVDATRLTLDGTTVGTANYLSPEQVDGLPVTPASDVYSLGLVLLECLTGNVAYPGSGVQAALARLRTQPPVPDSLPRDWQDLLRAMTSREPSRRPSARQVCQRLAPGPSTEPVSTARPVPPVEVEEGPSTQAMAAHELLDVPPSAPAHDTAILRDGHTTLVVTPDHPRTAQRRQLRLAIAAMAAIALLVLIVGIATSGSDQRSTPKPPAYPSVPGQIGTDLQQLQKAVG